MCELLKLIWFMFELEIAGLGIIVFHNSYIGKRFLISSVLSVKFEAANGLML